MFLVMPSFAANSLTPNEGCSLVNEYSAFRIKRVDLLTGRPAAAGPGACALLAEVRPGWAFFMRCSNRGFGPRRRQITGFIAVRAQVAQTAVAMVGRAPGRGVVGFRMRGRALPGPSPGLLRNPTSPRTCGERLGRPRRERVLHLAPL